MLVFTKFDAGNPKIMGSQEPFSRKDAAALMDASEVSLKRPRTIRQRGERTNLSAISERLSQSGNAKLINVSVDSLGYAKRVPDKGIPSLPRCWSGTTLHKVGRNRFFNLLYSEPEPAQAAFK